MNQEQIFDTQGTPTIVIREVYGALHVRTGDEARIRLRGEVMDAAVRQTGAQLIIDKIDNCHLAVPVGTHLTVETIYTNADIVGTQGELLIQRVHGNLKLRETGAVQLGTVDGNLTIEENRGNVAGQRVAGNVNLTTIQGDILFETISGNCRLRAGGALRVERVRGNLQVREGLRLTATRVDGDLAARTMAGDLLVGHVGGNASVVDVAGEVICEAVGGDLRARGPLQSLVGQAGGSAKLRFAPQVPQRLQVTAGGDIRCRVPTTTQAQVKLRCGDELRVRDLPVTGDWNRQSAEFTLGAGEGQIDLTAGGSIRLIGDDDAGNPDELDMELETDFNAHFQQELGERAGELLQQVSEQMEVQVENLTRRLDERLAHVGNGEEIAAKLQQKLQVVIRRAEEKLAEAARRMEQQAARDAARQERRTPQHIQVVPGIPVPPQPPAAAHRTPPSDEERMLILRMLEEGKITVEQAEKLLTALV